MKWKHPLPQLNRLHPSQTSVAIYPNGIVGPRTQKAIQDQKFITNKDFPFTQDIAQGSRGDEVKELQTRLRDTNFYPFWLPSTGWFGPITQSAVKIFQAFSRLVPTGTVAAEVRSILNGR